MYAKSQREQDTFHDDMYPMIHRFLIHDHQLDPSSTPPSSSNLEKAFFVFFVFSVYTPPHESGERKCSVSKKWWVGAEAGHWEGIKWLIRLPPTRGRNLFNAVTAVTKGRFKKKNPRRGDMV